MIEIEKSKYTDRLLARFIVEAKTPVAVGNGQKDIMTDGLVATDVNGLPYLPASSISGVIRSMLKIDKKNDLWGYQDRNEGHGSEIIFSEGKILNSQGEVVDGLNVAATEDDLLRHYKNLPIRQHVCITDKGTTKKHGKFDEQVVFAGTRFCFEIEIVAENDSMDSLQNLIKKVRNRDFRIGGGTRSGFGELYVVSVQSCRLELDDPKDLQNYLDKSSNLAESSKWWGDRYMAEKDPLPSEGTKTYTLEISPVNFVLFGSGFSSEDGNAAMTAVKASKVVWDEENHGSMLEDQMLIPATSVKGALRHRVAYHFNRLNKRWATSAEAVAEILKDCKDVDDLFGYISEDGRISVPGRVYISDVIQSKAKQKLLNHVCIDRFTGGAIESAFFTEQVDYAPEKRFQLEIKIKNGVEGKLKDALEAALDDICEGRLPLGGGVNRGNGLFTGTRI